MVRWSHGRLELRGEEDEIWMEFSCMHACEATIAEYTANVTL